MKMNDVIQIIESFAPKYLKEDYDNVGLMIGEETAEVTSILGALDCTTEVINEALEKGCNLIITHHPLLFNKPQNITNNSLQGRKIIALIQNNICNYACHTNLDSVKGGLNDKLAELMNLKNVRIIQPSKYEGNGIGRIGILEEETDLRSLILDVKQKLSLYNIRYCGDDNKKIKTLAIINGSGEDYFNESVKLGADCIITGDTSYHPISDMREEGIAVVDAGHFGTEWIVFKDFLQTISKQLLERGYNNKLIISECSVDPYKYK